MITIGCLDVGGVSPRAGIRRPTVLFEDSFGAVSTGSGAKCGGSPCSSKAAVRKIRRFPPETTYGLGCEFARPAHFRTFGTLLSR